MAMKNSNKRQLITSMMSLGLTVTMLTGTTLAWFTDSATSIGNIIQSGTLKVDLLHHTGEGNPKSIKDNPTHKIFNYDKWEPGYTQVETLTIQNKGNLALEYTLNAIMEGTQTTGRNGEKLSQVIDVYMASSEKTPESLGNILTDAEWKKIGTLEEWLNNTQITGKILEKGSSTVTIALNMREDAGNNYQGLTIGQIDLNLSARQWSHEKDSFGEGYDSNLPAWNTPKNTPYTLENGLKISYYGTTLYSLGDFKGDVITANNIPESVKIIGNRAFENSTIKSIDLTGIKKIGNRSFRNATSLASVTLSDTLTTIGPAAFQSSGLTGKVTIPESVTEIGENAFYAAKGITSINIPKSITNIKENTFRETAIKEITIPKSVKSIGMFAFRDCKQLMTINYEGTKDEWDAIEFGQGWKLIAQNATDLTVKCSDGDIVLKRTN